MRRIARILLIEGDKLRPCRQRTRSTALDIRAIGDGHPARARRRSSAARPSIGGRPPSPTSSRLLDSEYPGRRREQPRPSGSAPCSRVPLMRDGGAYGAIFTVPPRAARVPARPGRAGRDLRAPGGDRDRQRAPVQRDQGGARPADRDQRDPARDLELADRRAAGDRRGRRRARAILCDAPSAHVLLLDDGKLDTMSSYCARRGQRDPARATAVALDRDMVNGRR